MKKLLTLIIMASMAFTMQAQNEKGFEVGNSVNFIFPQAKLADSLNFGWGIYGNVDYNFNKHLAARFDIGWNSLSGSEHETVDSLGVIHTSKPAMSAWEFTAGLRANVSVVYIEVRGGYFTGVKSWGFVPAVGLRFGHFDLQGSYTIAGDNKWFTAKLGYYWAK